MALHQHSCWRSVKPPCQRGTHTVPKSLMEPVKTTGRSLAASLILSSNYCWGCTMPCIPMAGLSQADMQEGQISPRLPQSLFWEWKLDKESLAPFLVICWPALSHVRINTQPQIHTQKKNLLIKTHAHTVYQIYLGIRYAARKLISGIGGLANWGFVLSNQASNEWDEKPLSSHDIL